MEAGEEMIHSNEVKVYIDLGKGAYGLIKVWTCHSINYNKYGVCKYWYLRASALSIHIALQMQ